MLRQIVEDHDSGGPGTSQKRLGAIFDAGTKNTSNQNCMRTRSETLFLTMLKSDLCTSVCCRNVGWEIQMQPVGGSVQ